MNQFVCMNATALINGSTVQRRHMSVKSCQISGNQAVWSTACSGWHKSHQSCVLLAFLAGNPQVMTSWASYQIRKIAGCACAGNAGNVFPRRRFQRKPIVSDPGMHHGTCVTHVPWCMSGSLTCGDGENVPGIPGACAPAILRIWQEAHEGRKPNQYYVIPLCEYHTPTTKLLFTAIQQIAYL